MDASSTVRLSCTCEGCNCNCFTVAEDNSRPIRECNTCTHSWVWHALDKLTESSNGLLTFGSVFDMASMILYGTNGIPVRLKILLDRLLSRLQHNQVLQIIYGFGWTYEEYARSYKLQDGYKPWVFTETNEELRIIKEFKSFVDTRTIAGQFLGMVNNVPVAKNSEVSAIQCFMDAFKMKKDIPTLQGPYIQKLPTSGRNEPVSQASSIPLPVQEVSKTNFSEIDSTTESRFSKSLNSEVKTITRPFNPVPMRSLSCRHCPRKFSSQIMYRRHLRSAHRRHIVRNSTTKLTKNGYSDLNIHGKSHDTNSTPLNNLHQLEMLVTSVDNKVSPQESFTLATSRASSAERQITSDVSPSTYSQEVKSDEPPSLGISSDGGIICGICQKVYKNKVCLKQHYNNVHLRLMHVCWVENCNSSFPSKRSRDRHSLNLNLHRNILPAGELQVQQQLLAEIGQMTPNQNYPGSTANNAHEDQENLSDEEEKSLKMEEHYSLISDETSSLKIKAETDDDQSGSNDAPSNDSTKSNLSSSDIFKYMADIPDSSLRCPSCFKVYSSGAAMRLHFRNIHIREMHQCLVPGCMSTFNSVRSRNRHSMNEKLHQSLPQSV